MLRKRKEKISAPFPNAEPSIRSFRNLNVFIARPEISRSTLKSFLQRNPRY